MSKLGQLRTCLNLMTARQISWLSPLRDLSLSITYLLLSLLVMLKFPSNSLWRIWVLHWTVILLWMHMSPILLGHATLNCVVWHKFVDSWQVLHWLPVKVRSTYKIACLCYHCHSSTAPSYVTDMLHKKPLHTRNTRSSSYTMHLLNRPAHSKATLGDRSFSFASSSVWNSIPIDVRCAPSLSSFKSHLKTCLFRSVYKDWTVSLITVHMCMVWPCYCFVGSLS